MTGDDDIRTESVPARRLVKRIGLHEQVVERLRRMVLSGDLDSQERLNEVAISEALNVSRTPLREAIKLLASEGLLELLPGRGARVRRYNAAEIFDMFEVIAALERHATEHAVLTMDEKTINAVELAHQQMCKAHRDGAQKGYFRANQKIHALLVANGGSSELQAVHATLANKVRHNRTGTLTSPERWDQSLEEHEALIAAIRARDADAAGKVMMDHIRKAATAIVDLDSAGAGAGARGNDRKRP